MLLEIALGTGLKEVEVYDFEVDVTKFSNVRSIFSSIMKNIYVATNWKINCDLTPSVAIIRNNYNAVCKLLKTVFNSYKIVLVKLACSV